MTSLFEKFLLNVQYLPIQYVSYNKGSKGTVGAFDLPTQVTINADDSRNVLKLVSFPKFLERQSLLLSC